MKKIGQRECASVTVNPSLASVLENNTDIAATPPLENLRDTSGVRQSSPLFHRQKFSQFRVGCLDILSKSSRGSTSRPLQRILDPLLQAPCFFKCRNRKVSSVLMSLERALVSKFTLILRKLINYLNPNVF